MNDVAAGLDDGVLGCNRAVSRDADFDRREERVGHLVGGEGDVVVLEEALGQEVAEGVVLLVEREDCGIGRAYK